MNYEDAVKITEKNSCFYSKNVSVNGYNVAMFHYMMADFKDFNNCNAFEMRGLTFVQNKNGEWSKPFLHLHKFFNLNQATNYMSNDLKDKKLVYVYEKLDGSMIRFIPIGDKVFAKTKMSFESKQAVSAQSVYNTNFNVKSFVDFTIKNNLAAIFEYVSPFNRVVVRYKYTDLVLVALRDNSTGRYLNIDDYGKKWGIRTAKKVEMDYRDTMSSLDSEELEGYVLHFDDGQMVKVKTPWYLKNHRLLTVDVQSTNFIINCILDETIDDLISNIPEDQFETIDRIKNIREKVVDFILCKYDKIKNILGNYDGDKKTFALSIKDDEDFHLIMQSLKNPTDEFIISLIKNYVEKNTNALEKANKFLETI